MVDMLQMMFEIPFAKTQNAKNNKQIYLLNYYLCFAPLPAPAVVIVPENTKKQEQRRENKDKTM